VCFQTWPIRADDSKQHAASAEELMICVRSVAAY
jgi:hypothetical protein